VVAPGELAQVRAVHARGARGTRQVAVVAAKQLGDVAALPAHERTLLRGPERERIVERLARARGDDLATGLVGKRAPQRRIAEQHGALDRCAQLPHVSGPVVPEQLVDKLLRCTGEASELLVEHLDEQRDVVAALAQRWQAQRHHVEPVVEVGAEVSAVDGRAQILVSRRHHADVDADRIAATDALDHTLLDRAQEARLEIERQLADLVEEHGATGGALDRTDARGVRAGERALVVPEQLALDQRRRNRAAVDHDERRTRPSPSLVDCLGQQRLAGTGLALDQHRRVRTGNARQRLEHATHRDGATDRASEVVIRGQWLLDVIFAVLEAQRRKPQSQLGSRREPRGLDAVLPEVDAVRRSDVAQMRTLCSRGDQNVIARDSGIAQHERVAIRSTQRDLAVAVEDDRTTVRSIDHAHAQAAIGESIRAHAKNVCRHSTSIARIMSDMVEAVGRRYEIVCRLAGGGMADLYLGRTLGPGGFERLVVIKRLSERLAARPSAVQALFDEARIAATLSHANIVQVTDIEICDGQVSIVMEFLHGHDAAHLLRRMRRNGDVVPLDQAVAIVLGVCAGLHHAHDRVDARGKSLEIVHRDVSPHNVLITYDGAIKLVDFGIARASVRKGNTEHGFIKGKPGYIAPEVILGRQADRRTDVWGAAVLLYQLTTGVTPFGIGTSFDELARVTRQDAPLPSFVVPDYPAELEDIVMRGLERDPADRYDTADAMRLELDAFARARGLDLSPFRVAALMERVFAQNLAAWRQSQRMGRSLAEHVAAFKTSGAHELVDLPGDPTEPVAKVERTAPVATADVVGVSVITAPTKILRPAVYGALTPIIAAPLPPAKRRRWQRPVAVVLGTPIVLLLGLLTWAAIAANRAVVVGSQQPYASAVDDVPRAPTRDEEPHAPKVDQEPQAPTLDEETHVPTADEETYATAVDDEPIAHPVVALPIEPAPAAAEPAASESNIESETAVAHVTPAPARRHPSAKPAAKRPAARNVQTRALPPPARRAPPADEDDLDALLPR
jgi:serine/threonine protein kinase